MRLETKEHKQRLIDIFVNAVYLYDDKLVIAFNYKEATKTVSLKEVTGSIIECAGVPKRNDPTRGHFFIHFQETRKIKAKLPGGQLVHDGSTERNIYLRKAQMQTSLAGFGISFRSRFVRNLPFPCFEI